MRSNCCIWALCLYWRRRRRRDEVYLAVRKSRWGWFPHVLLLRKRRDGLFRAVSYKPLDPTPRKIPPPLFKGTSRWGDL
ncbi:MAG: hypothetical protein O9341_07850 [Paucibacter sp.]|nr:hypothetical protein [Roseateles sp.]